MWLLSNRISVRDSGILKGLRDCHCHLLPGVDDGVEELDETLQILALWEEAGVKEVWLTPHVMEDYPNTPDDLRSRFARLKADYATHRPPKPTAATAPITLHLAAEHMMDGLFAKRLGVGDVLAYSEPPGHGDGKWLLVETSYYIPPMNMEQTIGRIKDRGYMPLLAHPERYQYMDTNDYRHWKQQGVRLQLNVPSLAGAYGPEVQQKAEWLLRHEMYDCCGTDTHSLDQVEMFLDSMIRKKIARNPLFGY